MSKLNQRQIAFCEAYIAGTSAAEAARKAGYSDRTSRSIGQRLLTFVDIQNYIEQRNTEIKAANTADIEEIRTYWTQTMRDSDEKTVDRLKASELLARSQGIFLERTESEVNISGKSSPVVIYLPHNGREEVGGIDGGPDEDSTG